MLVHRTRMCMLHVVYAPMYNIAKRRYVHDPQLRLLQLRRLSNLESSSSSGSGASARTGDGATLKSSQVRERVATKGAANPVV